MTFSLTLDDLFSFTTASAQPAQPGPTVPAATPAVAASAASAPTVLKLLVVDDESGIRDLLLTWLRRLGHTIECAASGQEALRRMREQPYDVVITDIVMPDGDGFELISAVRKHLPTARILAISGGGNFLRGPDCLKIAKGLGAHALVLKPFTFPQLSEGLTAALKV